MNPLARQRIHKKNQAVFSSKDKSKKLKCHLLPFLFGTLRVKYIVNNPKHKKTSILLVNLINFYDGVSVSKHIEY